MALVEQEEVSPGVQVTHMEERLALAASQQINWQTIYGSKLNRNCFQSHLMIMWSLISLVVHPTYRIAWGLFLKAILRHDITQEVTAERSGSQVLSSDLRKKRTDGLHMLGGKPGKCLPQLLRNEGQAMPNQNHLGWLGSCWFVLTSDTFMCRDV